MKKNVEQKIDETLGAQNSAPVFQDLKQKTKRKGAKSEIDTNQIIIDDLLNVEKDDKQEDKNAQENVKEEVVLKDAEPSLKKNENLESAEAKNDDTIVDDAENVDSSIEVSEEQQLTEVNQAVTKQKSKKKKILTLLFFILNIAVITFIIVKQALSGELTSIGELFVGGRIKWAYFLLAVVVWALIMVFDTMKTTYLIKKCTGKSRPFLAYKVGAIGRYYDNITPMSTGGQPFQVFYLSNRGLSGSSALSVSIARYVIDQIAWILMSLIAILISIFYFGSRNLVSVASYVGFALNFTVVFITVLISVNEKIGKTLVAKVFKLLHKMKIIKNYEKHYDNVMRTVNNFQTTMRKYASSIKSFIGIIFLEFVENLLIYFTNIFVFLMFGGTLTLDIALMLIVFNILISLASGFMPLPGGTGVAEISYPALFKDVFPAGTIGWAMLLNRLLSYYAYILQGACVLVYDYAIGNKRYEWQKKKWELEDESSKFKAEQLKRYKKRNKQKLI